MSTQIETLISQERIQHRVQTLAVEIDQHYLTLRIERRPLVLAGVLKGAYMFLADLSRALQTKHEIGFVSLASYQGTKRGELRWRSELQIDVNGKDVLLVEDIVDTGTTIHTIIPTLLGAYPETVNVATLLHREQEGMQAAYIGATATYPPKFVGFTLTHSEFVVGYGLDYNERYRNLPYIGVITEEN